MSQEFGKNAGKTEFSGRRRTTTRTSGFTSHADSTGGEFQILQMQAFKMSNGQVIDVIFSIPDHENGNFVGYGGWYAATQNITVEIRGSNHRCVLTDPNAPNWSKFGSMWVSGDGFTSEVVVRFIANGDARIAFYGLNCGVINHRHLSNAKIASPILLGNMYQFSPEAHFYTVEGLTHIRAGLDKDGVINLYTKSCNRCARFLPINVFNERLHLSFSNHCVADHRRPCSHKGFGKLRNIDTDEILQLNYGYQLECRFCKKFEVNAAHNPQRSPAQMKEDGTRRRHLELLLTELFGGSPQLLYRHASGRELANDIWKRFNGKCFNCEIQIESQNKMHLDHTRPLALFWPLDGTATCLCGSCNSQKRDRSPSDFYSASKLFDLHIITGIPLADLQDPTPNLDAIELLRQNLDWFFDVFCKKRELIKEYDGKVAAELLVKAIQKTLNKCAGGAPFNIQEIYDGLSGE